MLSKLRTGESGVALEACARIFVADDSTRVFRCACLPAREGQAAQVGGSFYLLHSILRCWQQDAWKQPGWMVTPS